MSIILPCMKCGRQLTPSEPPIIQGDLYLGSACPLKCAGESVISTTTKTKVSSGMITLEALKKVLVTDWEYKVLKPSHTDNAWIVEFRKLMQAVAPNSKNVGEFHKVNNRYPKPFLMLQDDGKVVHIKYSGLSSDTWTHFGTADTITELLVILTKEGFKA